MATAAATTDSAKRKHIVWNEQNLSYNEANKSVRTLPDDRSPPAVVEARRRSTDRSSATPPPFVVPTPSPPLPSRNPTRKIKNQIHCNDKHTSPRALGLSAMGLDDWRVIHYSY